MIQFSMFSSGLDLANLVVSSDLLQHSWDAISDLHKDINPNDPTLPFSVKYRAYPRPPNGALIAFVSSPTCTVEHLQEEGRDLVTSPALFEFLSTKAKSSFSIHKAAITLFGSLHDELSLLKNQFGNATPLIITGHSLGGSIAALFTLWLLESISPTATKRPLCITFGSPLIGDDGFQRAILEHPTWNSCFLHVASNQDPIPKLFISPHNVQTTSIYKPFGTFLLCSKSGCACFEEPESILALMVAMSSESVGNRDPNEGLQCNHYGEILKKFESEAICRGISELGERVIDPLRAGVIIQLEAIEVKKTQVNSDINALITEIEKKVEKFQTRKRDIFDPNKRLNDRKITMASLEWYKKESIHYGGYYDSYKNVLSQSRSEIVIRQRRLTLYWKDKVAEAERMPQKTGASFRTRWLYAGTNYRRMVEPLDIADYYKNGKKDYRTQGRSKHYVLLEQWLKDEKPAGDQNNSTKERNTACSLTEDSCFWAHVEEAIISCTLLKDGETSEENKELSKVSLIDFEHYVMDLIKNYAVSTEIFWEQSSFMKWWTEYEMIIAGTSHNSPLTDFMKNGEYQHYT